MAKWFHFTSATTIMQLSEIFLKKIGYEGYKGDEEGLTEEGINISAFKASQ